MSSDATVGHGTPNDNPVFPSRMIAVCQAGHTWPVEIEWAIAHVPGRAPDETMQIPSPQPRYCRECYVSVPGLAVPYAALKHLEVRHEDRHESVRPAAGVADQGPGGRAEDVDAHDHAEV